MSNWKDTATLVSVSSTRNANGYPETAETAAEVFADVKSITMSEFYEAMRSGIDAVIAFDMFADDYSGQAYVEYDDVRYKVERVYRHGDIAELKCSEVKAHDG